MSEQTSSKELLLKSLWHLALSGVGIYEYRNHNSKLAKVLAVGLIAFHADAAVCDILDRPTTLQRLLHKLSK